MYCLFFNEKQAYKHEELMAQKVFYTTQEERWNAWSHAAGIVLGLCCCFLFVGYSLQYHSDMTVFSLILYFLGMLASYVASTVYHALPPQTEKRLLFRKIDHAAIYWHIAGSYSPITLIALLDHDYWGWGLFGFIWTFALAGTLLSFLKLKDHSYLETVTYVGMGLSILVAFKPLLSAVDRSVIFWIIAEGVMFITGAIFYSVHKRRFMHTVFHFFVLGGTICHLIAVWQLLHLFGIVHTADSL